MTTNRRFTLAGRTVKGISNDTMWLIGSADSLVTQYAVKGYISSNYGPGTINAYNFNPSDFIVSGYDISIRFPQDPGEPLFTNSPAFNLTQQHIDFIDSLMLALRDSNYTYFADRDFYGTGKGNSPFFTKSLILTTNGSGAASYDSGTKVLNIPLLPSQPLPGDSIDYGFTSMTTIYNEAGPGEYVILGNGVTANKDNFNFPFRQLKSLDVGGWNNADYVSFSVPATANSTTFTYLRGFLRLKQAVPVDQSLSFQFYRNGTAISSLISMVNYGLDKSKINSYMNITIPMSAFNFTSNVFDEIRLVFGGGASPSGLYLDLFQFQNATAAENTYLSDIFRNPGSTQVYKVLGGQNVPAYIDSVGSGEATTAIDDPAFFDIPTGYLLIDIVVIPSSDATVSLGSTSGDGDIAEPITVPTTGETYTINQYGGRIYFTGLPTGSKAYFVTKKIF